MVDLEVPVVHNSWRHQSQHNTPELYSWACLDASVKKLLIQPVTWWWRVYALGCYLKHLSNAYVSLIKLGHGGTFQKSVYWKDNILSGELPRWRWGSGAFLSSLSWKPGSNRPPIPSPSLVQRTKTKRPYTGRGILLSWIFPRCLPPKADKYN